LQRSCATWTALPGQVVYEEDPTRSRRLAREEGFKREAVRPREGRLAEDWTPPVSWRPANWSLLFGETTSWGGAFMHERAAPTVGKRIVLVSFVLGAILPDGRRSFILGTHKFIPADWQLGSRVQRESGSSFEGFDLAPSDSLRIYAGYPDPTDASRFMIPYVLNGQDGFFEGVLHPDGNVTLKRVGPAPEPLPPWPRDPSEDIRFPQDPENTEREGSKGPIS
jgi:hypothetical protein